MKSIVTLFGLLVTIFGFSQADGFSFEKTQLTNNYVLVTVTGPVDNYATYLCKGNVDEVNTAVFENEDLTTSPNERGNLEEIIDLGFLPSDIYYLNQENENMIVYGGNKLIILDGDTHANVIDSFMLDTKVSDHNMAFMPVSPYRVQIVKNSIDDNGEKRTFIICADEGGGLTVIESIYDDSFHFIKKFIDEGGAQLLSSSIKGYCDTSFYWALNYWDGTCKFKKFNWDKIEQEYFFEKERIFYEEEIIDFTTQFTTAGPLRLALLDKVIEIDPVTLQNVAEYDVIVDKLEYNCGHIKDEHKLYLFDNQRTFENINIITMATGSCYDRTNQRVYFTGYYENYSESDFRVINFNPDDLTVPFKHSLLDGAMEVQYNSTTELPVLESRVVAVGNNEIKGFDDNGETICSDDLDCHYGYRIAFDTNLENPTSEDRIGISVACLNDGLLVQREGFECSAIPQIKIVETGISSSLTCYNEVDQKVYFFYNGEGGTNIYALYDEITNETSFIPIGVDKSYSVIDCIYNKESNIVLAGLIDNCNDNINLLEISNGTPVVSEEFYGNAGLFTNYNEYIYFYVKSEPTNNYIKRLWQENSIIHIEQVPVNYEINAMDINKDEEVIYGSCASNNVIIEIDHTLNNVVYHQIEGNDPVDISYLTGLNKIYIAQYNTGIIEIRNLAFNDPSYISVDGLPKKIEYNPYQKEAYIISDALNEPGFTKITIINCITDQIIKEKLIRKCDGYIYDTINDQLYFHTNYPDINDNGALEYNIKSLNDFDNEFSNQVNTNFYTYSDIYLSKDRAVLSKPTYNYDSNFIYVGNYGSSKAFKIKAFDEGLTLNYPQGNKSYIKWLSFPRMERYKDEPFDAITFLERIKPWTLQNLYMEYKPVNSDLYISYSISNGWDPFSSLIELKSTQGYKLTTMSQYPQTCTLRFEGAKEDYNTPMNIVYPGENWVGYFLDISQKPLDALPADMIPKLEMIKTQYWTMYRDPQGTPVWFIHGKVTPFKYGDMVILKLMEPYGNTSFQWQNTGNVAENEELPKTTHFTFEEQSDYLPFYVETDSLSDIAEIAVLANGEVKGAAYRFPGDTITEVNGYLEGVAPGALIEFETWNGYKSEPVEKGNYVVINHERKIREKRNIYAGEKEPYYHVSLKSNEIYDLPPEIGLVTCHPNPFGNNTTFTFRINEKSNISIRIYDLQGNIVKILIDGFYPEGYYNLTWNGDNESGNRIDPGIYFYKVSTGNETLQTEKIVLIK